ncbi:hypothetical protein AV656_01570 [Bhargavaea cecembensis]|uniref:Uncharacterized protein n=1 Tax=Bhargavaea cecembensis TaxID=394098 RepID=A0A165HHL9_9BACL|nr:preprotein translocase subunit SecG [Bhargavaea cecembensis]KZE39994.1 hypothetical protein AV656_01570 [Bhargavaea cecembensis]
MLDYIFLVIAAIILFPILFLLMQKGKAGKLLVTIASSGFFIALAGIYLQNQFTLYYSFLGMLGLSFAASVLIGKRAGEEAVADVPDVLVGPVDFREESFDSQMPRSEADEFELLVESIKDGSGSQMSLQAAETTAAADEESDEIHDELEISTPLKIQVTREESAASAETAKLGALREEPMQYEPEIPTSAEENAGLLTDDDELPVVGTPIQTSHEAPRGESGHPAPDWADEDDFLEEDLESWLSSRPDPPDEMQRENEEAEPEPDPFGLLSEEDLIVEDGQDGKQ